MAGQNIATITFEEALELFKLPFDLNDLTDSRFCWSWKIRALCKVGRNFISIPKGEDPLSVDQNVQKRSSTKRKERCSDCTYKGEPVTKGTGRFGPFIKYKDIFVNVPKKYNFDNLSQSDINELIDAKLEKEANRYIQQWEKEKISIENGRWGPFIKFGKAMFKIPKKSDDTKYDAEELKEISLEEVKNGSQIRIKMLCRKEKPAAKKAATTKKTTVAKSRQVRRNNINYIIQSR
jgi:DNA topoisomerase-1